MKPFELIELKSNDIFDPTMICSESFFTQADFYGQWQKKLNRSVRRFIIDREQKTVAYFQTVKYPLVFGLNYLYIPYGPVLGESSDDLLSFIKQKLSEIADQEKAVFVRLDFVPNLPKDVLKKHFYPALLSTYRSSYFQPRAEWFLDLNKTENELLMNMHEKTRYSIRLSERKEIKNEIISENFQQYFEIFYKLLAETAERNFFKLHPKEYYENIFKDLPNLNSYLSIAKYKDEILAVDLVIVFNQVANYLFGGSSSQERNRMPTYSAQWQAILYAKKIGCLSYNFGGIVPENLNRIYKSWDGLTEFKKKFGGREVKHSDFFDIISNPFWYLFYNLRKILKK